MWAVGIILYEVLTGKHPFFYYKDTQAEYVKKIHKNYNKLPVKLDVYDYLVIG